MIVKIFRAVWFLSLLLLTAALLYGYALLPERVVVTSDATGDTAVARDTFFYVILSFITVINALVFLIAKVAEKNEGFRSWFYGLIVTFNIFFAIGINFIALYNSGERYDYSRLEVFIYSSIILFCVWFIAWPMYWGYRRLVSSARTA